MKHVKMYEVIFNHYYNDADYHTVSSARFDEYNKYVGEDGKEATPNNL